MGTQGEERESGSEEEKVTMSVRNVEAAGRGFRCEGKILEDPEKDMTCQWKCGRDDQPRCSHG